MRNRALLLFAGTPALMILATLALIALESMGLL